MRKMAWGGKLKWRSVNENEFADLVKDNVDLVYSTAFRCLNGSDDQARDVTQAVFIDLHRQWSSLPSGTVVPGWLYRHTRFLAWRFIRSEQRRTRREMEAVRRMEMQDNQHEFWEQLRPVIDRAVSRLKPAERNLVVLRFFRGLSLREIGETLEISEDAARMRVGRAVERLRIHLERMGIRSTSGALSEALFSGALTTAPVGLAHATLTAIGGMTGGLATGGVLKGIMIMKTKTVLVGSILVLGVGGPFAMYWGAEKRNDELRHQVDQREQELLELKQEIAASNTTQQEFRDQLEDLRNERSELFKLRGLVNQLRSDNERLKDQVDAVAENESPIKSVETGLPRLRRFEGVVDAAVLPGETLVTGGWEIEPGRYGIVMLDAELVQSEEGDQVLIRGSVLEGPKRIAASLNLEQPGDPDAVNTHGEVLDSMVLDEFLGEELEMGGISKLSGPVVKTLSGRQATISIAKEISGENGEVQRGLSLSVIPEVQPNAEGVNLKLVSEWVVPENE